MATATGPDTLELQRILYWRFEQLVAAGYAHEQAIDLSAEPGVDLHEAIRLVEQGCPPELAFRILV
jgi:hypothetical protein